ncbi:GNAT family N-acetyltransferase [Krasilnikoviella flava]|uniref:Protein N-acetyltransferase, RimJ/RimL family n=1 Tax=Krasilnikoviella flava TaxID=526729 RepID=A0A1T5KY14_9MICO|nr:GNAT family N-acetyltransferase [Krasilnikoviella flava]SKC68676.1 Protein N-acetyltransferase, RimJ/RimL family [Krasilnikoviella flava]
MGVLSAQGPETVLETDRLLLRPWRVAEAVVQRELWTERDPRVPAHRRLDAEGRPTLGEMEGWIRDGSRTPSLALLAAERRSEGDVVGYCGLIDGALGPDEPELAFELLRRVWGAGYATEAAGAVVGWAQESGYHRLWATVRDWNVASRRVLTKVGFAETARVERDDVHGDSLFMTRSL